MIDPLGGSRGTQAPNSFLNGRARRRGSNLIWCVRPVSSFHATTDARRPHSSSTTWGGARPPSAFRCPPIKKQKLFWPSKSPRSTQPLNSFVCSLLVIGVEFAHPRKQVSIRNRQASRRRWEVWGEIRRDWNPFRQHIPVPCSCLRHGAPCPRQHYRGRLPSGSCHAGRGRCWSPPAPAGNRLV